MWINRRFDKWLVLLLALLCFMQSAIATGNSYRMTVDWAFEGLGGPYGLEEYEVFEDKGAGDKLVGWRTELLCGPLWSAFPIRMRVVLMVTLLGLITLSAGAIGLVLWHRRGHQFQAEVLKHDPAPSH